jgi:hypothetical protein
MRRFAYSCFASAALAALSWSEWFCLACEYQNVPAMASAEPHQLRGDTGLLKNITLATTTTTL